jgi:hypothetical protein
MCWFGIGSETSGLHFEKAGNYRNTMSRNVDDLFQGSSWNFGNGWPLIPLTLPLKPLRYSMWSEGSARKNYF